jgi:hypothetical protein
MISSTLTNLTSSEKSLKKAEEISKQTFSGKYQSKGLEIEIISVTQIARYNSTGVEVLVKAWKDDVAIGFGTDGTIETERIRIYNPPILIPDVNGTILRTKVDTDGNETEHKYTENARQALIDSIAHTCSLPIVGKNGGNIRAGTIGNTVSTFYPYASTESTSVDGWIESNQTGWDTAHDASAGTTADDSGAYVYARSQLSGSLGIIYRGFMLFDTSAIGSDTVSAATLSLEGGLKVNTDNDGDDFIAIVSSTPASNTAIVTGDFDQCGDSIDDPTEMHDVGGRIDIGSISTSAYNDWTLNSTGLAEIDTGGVSKFGVREGHDILDNPVAASSANYVGFLSADTVGTTSDPKLVVTHSGVPAKPRVMMY